MSEILIPPSTLSPEALLAVIESFILREGTDYGSIEQSLETKVEKLRRLLERGMAHLVFDPTTESVTFVTKAQWEKRSAHRATTTRTQI